MPPPGGSGNRRETSSDVSNPLADLPEHERCAQNPQASSSASFFDLRSNCLHTTFAHSDHDNSSVHIPTNLILRFSNEIHSDKKEYLFQELFQGIQDELDHAGCRSSGQTSVRLWNSDIDEVDNDISILFNTFNALNIIIDVHTFSDQLFQYDILVRMPEDDRLRSKIESSLDLSFLQRHEHPSEQAVSEIILRSYPQNFVLGLVQNGVSSIWQCENPD
jgi:hypothetical protein